MDGNSIWGSSPGISQLLSAGTENPVPTGRCTLILRPRPQLPHILTPSPSPLLDWTSVSWASEFSLVSPDPAAPGREGLACAAPMPVLTEAQSEGRTLGPFSSLTLGTRGAQSQPCAVTWAVAQTTFQQRQTPPRPPGRDAPHGQREGPQLRCLLTPPKETPGHPMPADEEAGQPHQHGGCAAPKPGALMPGGLGSSQKVSCEPPDQASCHPPNSTPPHPSLSKGPESEPQGVGRHGSARFP